MSRKLRLPAVFCAFAVLLCALVARPWAEMGICDEWSYIRTAQRLFETGQISYIGWANAIEGWQLYLALAVYKIFGFSFTGARMTVLLVAAITAFLIQRIFVRFGLTERNAVIASLTFSLSPLLLLLSTTFMTDVPGLFAMVACLYGCVRAVQTRSDAGASGWILAAVAMNALCGTSRQIAWLGILILVPSTLFLLRRRPMVLVTGVLATLAGCGFIYATMRWFAHQPYTAGESLLFRPNFQLVHRSLMEWFRGLLSVALMALPVLALFLPEYRRIGRTALGAIAGVCLGYAAWAYHWRFSRPDYLVEPTQGDWVTATTTYGYTNLQGTAPVVLPYSLRVAITAVVVLSLLALIASLVRAWNTRASQPAASEGLPWKTISVLLGPITAVYLLLLVPHSTFKLFDRYMLFPTIIGLLLCGLYYQRCWQQRMPSASVWLIVLWAGTGILFVHNQFSFYRARTTLARNLISAGVPETAVDFGWEQNFWVETKQSRALPPTLANSVPVIQKPDSSPCHEMWFGETPHLAARYAVSFDRDLCDGPAPFAPVQYSLWGRSKPAFLYVIKYPPPWKPEGEYAVPAASSAAVR